MLKTYSSYYPTVSSLDRCGHSFFRRYGLLDHSPSSDDSVICDWWMRVNSLVSGEIKRVLNSLIVLTSWRLWNHRNDCVFNGENPSIQLVVRQILEEAHLWGLADARGLTHLEVANKMMVFVGLGRGLM